MSLTGQPLLILLVAASVCLPLGTLLIWNRARGPAALKAFQRVTLVVVSQVCAVMLAGVLVNNQYALYSDWHDLLGSPTTVGPIVGAQRVAPVSLMHSAPLQGGGRLVSETVHGAASGITDPVLVYLPRQYDQPAWRHRRFPVVEFFPGWPGTDRSWLRVMNLASTMRNEIAAGRVKPFIALMPTTFVARPRDTECTNVPNGPQNETWLSTDMQRLVLSQFRAATSPNDWGVVGISTGGYCAAKILLHHPEIYRSGISMGGYFTAIRDHTTGDLWGGSQARRNENDPTWLVTHGHAPRSALLVFVGRQDQDSYRQSLDFLRVPHGALTVYSSIAPTGGHNLKALSAALPPCLDWLSTQLSDPPGIV